jgi:hypothetical protein
MWDILNGGFPLEPMRKGLAHVNIEMPRPPSAEASRLGELKRLWSEAGLESIETRTIPVQVVHRDFEAFWDSNLALATPAAQKVRQLAPGEIDRLKSYLREILPTDGEGRVSFGSTANAVKGRVPA